MKMIGVIGAGTMGSGIAHVCAFSGYKTVLMDLSNDLLEASTNKIRKNLEHQLSKDLIKKEKVISTMGNIISTTDYNSLSACNLIIEAVTESVEVKNNIFEQLNIIRSDETILASNTSSISITKIASFTNCEEKVVGMHFMNPVPSMQLVEIIRGKETNADTLKQVVNLVKSIGKTPIECNDSPGFISNRILMPMINEAIFCLMEGVGSAEAIDQIMKLGMAHPMGPLALADLIGLDVCLNIIDILFGDFADDKYRPCPLLKEMVDKGHLGRKTGQGFYKYNNTKN